MGRCACSACRALPPARARDLLRAMILRAQAQRADHTPPGTPLFYGRWSGRGGDYMGYQLTLCCGVERRRPTRIAGVLIDGGFAPPEAVEAPRYRIIDRRQGEATLTYLIGAPITILGVIDRSAGDSRPGNTSTYLLPGVLTWAQAQRAAHAAFPWQMRRLPLLSLRLVEVRLLHLEPGDGWLLELLGVPHG